MKQQLHTFKAPTLDEAYIQMRRRLGGDAVVLRTDEVFEGGILGFMRQKVYAVTASSSTSVQTTRAIAPAVEKYATVGAGLSPSTSPETVEYFKQIVEDAQRRMNAGSREFGRVSSPARKEPNPQNMLVKEVSELRDMIRVLLAEWPGDSIPRELAPYYRKMLDSGMERKTAAALVAAAAQIREPKTATDGRLYVERLKMEVRRRITVTGGMALTSGGARVAACVGPTGVGKTTNIAKLAALFSIRERARVALITADTYRVAASEQLHVYATIIGLPMRIVNDAKEIRAALREFKEYDLILVDTAGSSQFNDRQIAELNEILTAAEPDDVMLMLSAATQLEEQRSICENFRCLSPTSLFFTKLDETRRFGSLFTVLDESTLPLSYLSIGQNVPDDIKLAQPGHIAGLVLEGIEAHGRSSSKSA